MKRIIPAASLTCLGLLIGGAAWSASHREAPLTALDRAADIPDVYAFVSPDRPDTATFIVTVDPLLEPSNGPTRFPFDENILYAIRIDNDNDAKEDVVFEFRFTTEQRLPGLPVEAIGAGDGVPAPFNSPPPVPPGSPLIPPAITALDGPGSEGLGLRQSYTVTMRTGKKRRELRNADGGALFAVPSNVGPRTMPDYAALEAQGVYTLENGVTVFAGTTDDAFFLDLGATFDSVNFRVIPGPTSTGIPAVLSEVQDAARTNFISDDFSGYNVNTIAVQVPISMVTRRGNIPDADDPSATIGMWGTTSRAQVEVRRPQKPIQGRGKFVQVQRLANPLINELLIGIGTKDLWSRSEPKKDKQFEDFYLDPVLARAIQAAFGGAFDIPEPPRQDLAILFTYAPPIAAEGTKPGPVADLLRLNVGVSPTPFADASRLGVLGGDPAGFPNGRRPLDDVTDIVLRVVVGGALPGSDFDVFPNNRLGDGVNVDDTPRRDTFPYVGLAHDGRNSRHVDPGEPGCDGGDCPID